MTRSSLLSLTLAAAITGFVPFAAAQTETGAQPAAPQGSAIVPAQPTGTQLKPGWVVRTFPLASRYLEKTGDVLSAFVLPESSFHLNDHVPHSLFSKSTPVAYELTGYLDVKEAGEHSLGLIVDEGNSVSCASRASIENQVVFEDDNMFSRGRDKAFDPMIGTAKLDVGLYEVRIWIACGTPDGKPLRVRIISRTPSMSAPDVLPATRIGHKELQG